mgnify:CR=1 FL=1
MTSFSLIFAPLLDALRSGSLRITEHAVEAMHDDALFLNEVITSALTAGEILEDYPDDHPFPSCLVLGRTPTGDAVHSVWAYNARSRTAILITCYRPDPDRWIDFRVRKKP